MGFNGKVRMGDEEFRHCSSEGSKEAGRLQRV